MPCRWKYVITGVLEVDVKPCLHMWSWKSIRSHRRTVKCYKELYKTKITNKKPSQELLKALEVGICLRRGVLHCYRAVSCWLLIVTKL